MNKNERAKEAIRKIENCIMNDKCELIDCGYYGTLSYLQTLLDYINNVEQITHCRECKYYDKGHCVLWSMNFKEDFYCASAETT